MKSSTLVGILFGLAAIFGAYLWEGGSYEILFMLPAMLLVFGGTLAAGIAGSTWEQFKILPKLFWVALKPKEYDIVKIINQLLEFSYIVRRRGMLALDQHLSRSYHPFMKKLFQNCIDGADPDSLKKIVELDIYHISERHQQNINLFVKMGGYSPTMGIIGTVMGLIAALASAGNEPTELIHHIASAFIATMWGIIMANIVWLPIGDKLKVLHDNEIQTLQIIAEGVGAVLSGDMPMVIKSKLTGTLPYHLQDKIKAKDFKVDLSK